ncbi:MAG: 2-deoxy-D-gluconate 3-dehydrogenase [Phycisphaerales bacterium]|nr:2-deoxy-D-gluconate 3-dehydrogenase [Phycisphaerales bacterium]
MHLPDFNVTDRVALLTGSGRGIGLALAKALAAGGAAVVIQDIDKDVAQAEADAINTAGGRAKALGGDLADPAMPEQLAKEAIAAFGQIDILINNGSIQSKAQFFDYPIDTMRRELEANVLAPTRLCQLLMPAMVERKWGRVINFSSIQGIKGNDHMPAYAMSRASLENLTKGLARKFTREGVTVNCIAPGWYDNTHRNENQANSPEDIAKMGKWLPSGRLGQPEDCAGMCVLLCSRAGEYITGQILFVDGGMSL